MKQDFGFILCLMKANLQGCWKLQDQFPRLEKHLSAHLWLWYAASVLLGFSVPPLKLPEQFYFLKSGTYTV